jgi:hypothetical protein
MEDGEKQQVSNLIMMYTGKLSTLVPTLKMGPNFLIGKKCVHCREMDVRIRKAMPKLLLCFEPPTNPPNLATHPSNLANHPSNLATYSPNLATYSPNLATYPSDLATYPSNLATYPC